MKGASGRAGVQARAFSAAIVLRLLGEAPADYVVRTKGRLVGTCAVLVQRLMTTVVR